MSPHANPDSQVLAAEDDALGHYADRLRHYVSQSTSERTKCEYTSDWRDWTWWCDDEGVCPGWPARPVSVACYCASLADRGLAVATIQRRLVTIRQAHKRANEPDPTGTAQVEATVDGIRRAPEVNSDGEDAKAALRTRHLLAMIDELDDDRPKGIRDRALLLVGFCGGLRRSELVSLKVDDLTVDERGLLIAIRRSKGDQQAKGQEVSIHRSDSPASCPVDAVRTWLREADLDGDEFVFQPVDRWDNVGDGGISGRTVANVMKRAAKAAGFDAAQFSAHSLRSGFVTELKAAGKGDSAIMEQTRHSSAETLRRYDKSAARFRRNFTAVLGL